MSERELFICIIDDDLVSQFAIEYCIKQAFPNCRIIIHDSAESGLSSFQKEPSINLPIPDILFLDLQMEGMNGWKFLDEIHKVQGNTLKTDIFILSTFTNAEDRIKAKVHPMVKGYYAKPLSKEIAAVIYQTCTAQRSSSNG